jgi:hypothetical protein
MMTWGCAKPVTMSPSHVVVFKLAEFIEMWEYGLHEMSMGNQYAKPIAEDCAAEVAKHLELVLEIDEFVGKRAALYVEKRREQWELITT